MVDHTDQDNLFLAYWSNEGFESILDLNEYKDVIRDYDIVHMEATLSDDYSTLGSLDQLRSQLSAILHGMKLRAQMNNQRNYEAWVMRTTKDVSVEMLREMSKDSAQCVVDIFRSHGTILIDTRTPSRDVIT